MHYDVDDDLISLTLNTTNRPLRLRLGLCNGAFDEVLLAQRLNSVEAICDGIEMRILCLASTAGLPLKEFIGLPAELQIVTDRGALRSLCGIVTEASEGESDGGLATYQLVVRDALAVMERKINTRIFRNKSEPEIAQILCSEWRQSNQVMAAAFEFEFDQALTPGKYPRRESTFQINESDAAFLRRLLKRRGICWYFRAGRARTTAVQSGEGDTPAHTLVMFDNVALLKESSAGSVRFHRDAATEERDTITAWSAVRTLQAGSVGRFSWDYRNALGGAFMRTTARGNAEQGAIGSQLAASLDDFLIDSPHAADNNDDLAKLGRVRMGHHHLATKCFHAEGNVRDLPVGEWFTLDGHPEIDSHPAAEREFVTIAQHITAHNNLPKVLGARAERLLARNRWDSESAARFGAEDAGTTGEPLRFLTRLTCVRRGIPIVPDFDPRTDLPHPRLQSAIVVGPPGEAVHCDALARVKIRFPGTSPKDHAHANGAGASDTDADSAYVRVISGWAGSGPGANNQCGQQTLPRVGSEVAVDFMGGDPDKPVIIGQLNNNIALPPSLSKNGDLPGNRYLSGMKSQEVHGQRSNQLCFDDTPGEISVQVASEHADSQLNLGFMTQPRSAGRGAPRGEGAELRSNRATAVRGGAGVLITAGGDAKAHGDLLDRAGLVGLSEILQGISAQLATLAGTHAGDRAPGEQLQQLVTRLAHWHEGPGAQGGQPIVAASAEAGMLLASQANLLLGAQTRVDVVSSEDTAIACGRHLGLRAGQGVTLFAHADGIKVVTAGGAVLIESHDGDIDLKTPGNINLHAGKNILMQAAAIKMVAQGAQVDYGAGAITHQCSGAYSIKAGSFSSMGPGNGNPAGLTFPSTKLETDQRVILRNRKSGAPLIGHGYTAKLLDGRIVEGISDARGGTTLLTSDMLGNADLTVHPPEDA